MAELYAKDIVVRIPDGEYFAMPISRKNDIACQIDHYLTAALMEIRSRLGLADVRLEG
jgi:hypothetical protein